MNCGGDAVRLLTELRAKHAAGEDAAWGIDGVRATLMNMREAGNKGIWESVVVKSQTIKTAIESACMILRVDDIVAGIAKKDKNHQSAPNQELAEAKD